MISNQVQPYFLGKGISVNTEITENVQGYIFYDDQCGFCCLGVRLLHQRLLRAGYHFVPMQAGWALNALHVPSADSLGEMKLLTPDGKIVGGAEVWGEIARHTCFLYPLFILLQLPGMLSIAAAGYRFIATRRHQLVRKVNPDFNAQGYVKRVFFGTP